MIVNLKNSQTGQNIITSLIARDVNVSVEIETHQISTIDGQLYTIIGRETGEINMKFVGANPEQFHTFFGDPGQMINVEILNGISQQNYNCFLRSMDIQCSLEESEYVTNLNWIFFENNHAIVDPSPDNVISHRRKTIEPKLDWRQFGF